MTRRDSTPPVAPQRLAQQSSPAGRLLRSLPRTPTSTGTPPSLETLRRIRKQRDQRRALMVSLPLAFGAALSAALFFPQQLPPQKPAIEPENPMGFSRAERPRAVEEPRSKKSSTPQKSSASNARQNVKNAPPSHNTSDSDPATPPARPRTSHDQEDPSESATQHPTKIRTSADCANLVQSGKLSKASDCYAEAAQGHGTGAELALLEHARLQMRALGNTKAASQIVNSYLARFPRGALRREALLMQIDLLARTGKTSRLIDTIDAVLSEGLLAERRGELLTVQAEALAQKGNCKRALRVVQRAENHGEASSRLSTVRKNCQRTTAE